MQLEEKELDAELIGKSTSQKEQTAIEADSFFMGNNDRHSRLVLFRFRVHSSILRTDCSLSPKEFFNLRSVFPVSFSIL